MSRSPGAGKGDRTPVLLVLSGPSGAGKDTVLARLRGQSPNIHCAVTATTRSRRPGEVDGRDYIFITEAQFRELLAQDELLEHAQVYGRWYGVPRAQVRDSLARGQDVVVKTDVQGAETIRQRVPASVLVFLQTPSWDELERRLRERGTESDTELRVRLETARHELAQAGWFDYVVVNPTGDSDAPARRLLEIIEAEGVRVPRRQATV